MEWITDNVNLLQLFVSDSDSLWIFVCVQFTPDSQSSPGGRGRDEIHNHLVADQRFPSPILTDVGKEPMFNLVPFAGAWGQMAHRDLQPGFIGHRLQLGLPEPGPIAIAASTASGDQQPLCVGIDLLPHVVVK
jgi:hypothetical protein